MRLCIFLLLLSLIFIRPLNNVSLDKLILWNVGQGQWVTYKGANYCYHFDLGGEFYPSNFIKRECRLLKNFVSYTHWDQDHISFTRNAFYALPQLCLVHPPRGKSSVRKMKMINKIPPCKTHPKIVRSIPFTPLKPHLPNNNSGIFVVKDKILITGDSPQKEEINWLKNNSFHNIEYLIVGHHGSKTSTSNYLLLRLKKLKLALISSRKRRYGHPHQVVLDRIEQFNIPHLITEKWGHIQVQMK